jgi:glucose 1-dehydrogenase
MGLEGKVALITGGARGVGYGIAERFLGAGASVVVASRTASAVEEAVAALAAAGDAAPNGNAPPPTPNAPAPTPNALDAPPNAPAPTPNAPPPAASAPAAVAGVPCDVSDEAAVQALVAGVVERFGALDVLVCSHGIYPPQDSVLDYPVERFDETVAINLRGTFLAGREAARAMVAAGNGGRIVNISSTAGIGSVPNESAYDASKGGVHALTRAFALDLAPHRITVNAIAPGWIITPMIPEERVSGLVDYINPLRRFGAPRDVADAALWLADPASGYVTGTTIAIDGGQHAALGFANSDSNLI